MLCKDNTVKCNKRCFAYDTFFDVCTLLSGPAVDKNGNCKFQKEKADYTDGKHYPYSVEYLTDKNTRKDI